MRDIYNSLPFGVLVLKHDRRRLDVLFMNEQMKEILNVKDIEGLCLKDVWFNKKVEKFAKALKTPSPPTDYTLPVLDDNGEEKGWYKITVEEQKFEQQNALVLWATDISFNKEEERSAKKAAREADAMAEMKSNFLATMSHEIRTPLQSVYGLLELIAQEKPPATIREMVCTAQYSASGLLEILDDILDFAKMNADKMDLDMFDVPVRTLVRGIIEALAVKVHGKDIILIDDIEDNVPAVIVGDPKRLRQVIMNLLGNAMKFTEEGTITVRVTTNAQHLKRKKTRLSLRFEIIDTGIGMDETAHNKLFQAFSQADSSTSRKYGGTGLGLSISKKLINLMGGVIGVDSIEGEGSTFWFEIPTQVVSTEVDSENLPSLDGLHILSVEDHPQGAKEIVQTLKSMNAKVENVPSYKEGLELVKRSPFDVAIIDQGLPDGLGLNLIREIMEIRPYMGIIMYTVRNDKGLQHSLQSLGVKYLTKPASRLGLGQAVEEAAKKLAQCSFDTTKRLLIAEDNKSVTDMISRQLKTLGAEADFVENGVQAIEKLSTGQYGILFTDLHMPEMDGFELVKTIREQEQKIEKHTPVVVLTADIQMADRSTYLSHGFDECLLKPVSLGQFKRLLIRWGLLSEEQIKKAIKSETATGTTPKATKTPTKEPLAVDIEGIKKLTGTFDESSIEMLGLFVDMSRPLIERIKETSEHEDLKALSEVAHSLKGAARSAGCPHLGDLAESLQAYSENKKEDPALVQAVLDEFERVTETIQNMSCHS